MKEERISDQTLAYLAGRHVVASVSGGKDSLALSLWLSDNGINHSRVFADTSWENSKTYEYLNYLETKIGPITRVQGKYGMEDLILKKGMFPSRLRRFCTSELKVKPILKYLKTFLDAGQDVISAVGIRAGESKERSKFPEWEWQNDFDCETWRPLIGWSEEDVIDIIRAHDILPNPLYLEGRDRVGCDPCIFARKEEIRLISERYPERIDQIERLEKQVAAAARLRAEAKGVTLDNDPSFFQKRGAKGTCVPIRTMVEWARTSRGGKQFDDLFPLPAEGCARWGLCESPPSHDQDDDHDAEEAPIIDIRDLLAPAPIP